METYVRWKQSIKKFARYSPICSRFLDKYLRRKMARESLSYLVRESNRFYEILQKNQIDLILDVGAHDGITGILLRDHGYKGRIVSFEPISEVFERLKEWSRFAPPWESYNYALGLEEGEKKIKILGNKPASSFLNGKSLLKKELEKYGGADVEREELVKIKRLDDVYYELLNNSKSVLLKIDTQGYEKHVLDGAMNALRHIRLVKMELSFVEVYEGETRLQEMIPYMETLGYIPILIERGHVSEETLHQLQADVVFANTNPT